MTKTAAARFRFDVSLQFTSWQMYFSIHAGRFFKKRSLAFLTFLSFGELVFTFFTAAF
jgi:hypothetical protein